MLHFKSVNIMNYCSYNKQHETLINRNKANIIVDLTGYSLDLCALGTPMIPKKWKFHGLQINSICQTHSVETMYCGQTTKLREFVLA